MKTQRNPVLVPLISAAMTLLTSFAAEAGTQTVTLQQGLNFTGLRVTGPVSAAGTITAVTSGTDKVLTLSALPALSAASQYSIECQGGFWSPCIAWDETAKTVTVRLADGVTLPSAGENFILRRALTVPEIFGSGSSLKLTPGPVDEADLIRVRKDGEWVSLYHSAGSSGVWHIAGSPAPAESIGIFFPQMLVIERQAEAPLSVSLDGEERSWPARVSLTDPLLLWERDDGKNWTLLSTRPGAATVAASGAAGVLTASDTAAEADALLIPQSGETVLELHQRANLTWADGADATVAGTQPLAPGIIIERRSAAAPASLLLQP